MIKFVVILFIIDSFQYLGRVITDKNNDTKAVEKLISKAWNAYSKVKAVLKDRKTPMPTKKKTFGDDIYEWTGRTIAKLNRMVKNRND